MISYEQYLKETKTTVVQDTSSSAQQDAMIMSVIEEMTNQVAKFNEVDKQNKIINESSTAELERYKKQINFFEERQKFDLNDREEYIESQLRQVIVDKNAKVSDSENQIHSLKLQLNATVESHKTLSTTVEVLKMESKAKEDKYLEEIIELEKKKKALDNVVCKMAQRKVSALYWARKIVKQHDELSVIDTEETLELAKESRLKMHAKQNDPTAKEKKQCKESFQNNQPCNNQNTPEFHAFFEINELKAQLKAKDNSISKLKDHIATLKGKSVSEGDKYEKISKENADTLHEIVEQAREIRPLDSDLDFACKFATRIQELLVYVSATCPNSSKQSEKLIAVTPINKKKKVRFAKPSNSSSNTQKQVESCNTMDSNNPLLPSTRVISSTSASGSKPPSNTKKNRIS
ncbi:hypothetical protein Tco_1162209 [Tanacetum coccineum]